MKNELINESEETRGMRESIEEMESELAAMAKDIEDAKAISDPDVREVAVRNFEQMQGSTREMIATLKENYRMVLESEALEAKLSAKEDA